ncbi:MAG: sigma-54 interaction domain-containing protein [Myxococcota bacterium]
MADLIKRPKREVTTFHGIVTTSPEMEDLFRLMVKVARSDAPVLIRGETGTGKELVARALHSLSRRGSGPFRAINCATLTGEMLASELFGHVKGAFTGAVRSRPGLFRLADGGTVFLDEIAEMPLDIQARLLRVLQEKDFIPLGGTDHVEVDVRFLSATHQALRDAVAERRFREDLMYRIRVVPLYLPPLAERTCDVSALTWHFIDRFNQRGERAIEAISSEAMDAMLGYDWPGNVRELRNVVEYAYAIGDGPVLTLSELTPELRGEPPPRSARGHEPGEQTERQRILRALAQTGGRKGEAADLLDVSRSTLWRKMREYRIG